MLAKHTAADFSVLPHVSSGGSGEVCEEAELPLAKLVLDRFCICVLTETSKSGLLGLSGAPRRLKPRIVVFTSP